MSKITLRSQHFGLSDSQSLSSMLLSCHLTDGTGRLNTRRFFMAPDNYDMFEHVKSRLQKRMAVMYPMRLAGIAGQEVLKGKSRATG